MTWEELEVAIERDLRAGTVPAFRAVLANSLLPVYLLCPRPGEVLHAEPVRNLAGKPLACEYRELVFLN